MSMKICRLSALLGLAMTLSSSRTAPSEPKIPKSSIPRDTPAELRELMLRLYSAHVFVRSHAALSLGEWPAAAPFLVSMLDDDEKATHGFSVYHGPWFTEIRIGPWTYSIIPSMDATRALVKIGLPAVPALLHEVRSASHRDIVTLKMLSSAGPLRDASDADRWLIAASPWARAVWVLSAISDPDLAEPMLRSLKDPSPSVRCAAAYVFGRNVKDSRAIDPLISLLTDFDPLVRMESAAALGRLSDTRALRPLTNLLEDHDPMVRKEVAVALGSLRDERALNPLIAGVRDKSRDVREAVIEALGNFDDPRVLEALCIAMKDVSGRVRASAAKALGHWKDPHAAGILIAALRDPDPHVREKAADSLAFCQDPGAVGPLSAVLEHDTSTRVREAAAHTLDRMDGPGAIQALVLFRRQSSPQRAEDEKSRPSAARKERSLEQLRALDTVAAAAQDPSEAVRLAAFKALAQLEDPGAVIVLSAATGDPSARVRGLAAKLLGQVGGPGAIERLLTMLKDQEASVRETAASSLGSLEDPRAVEPLVRSLEHDANAGVRDAAAQALAKVKDPRAVNAVELFRRQKRAQQAEEAAAWLRRQSRTERAATKGPSRVGPLEEQTSTDKPAGHIEPPFTARSDPTVWIIKMGAQFHYHRGDCPYLTRKPKAAIKLSEAKRAGYTPCLRCRPPE
jgi:HEAT repeat protein